MSTLKPYNVVAGKYDGEGENVKYASCFATFDEAVEALRKVDDYPFARIELDQFEITRDGYSPSFNDGVFHITAGTAYPPGKPDPSTLDYDIKTRRLTSDIFTLLMVNGVDWIQMVHNGVQWGVDVPIA